MKGFSLCEQIFECFVLLGKAQRLLKICCARLRHYPISINFKACPANN